MHRFTSAKSLTIIFLKLSWRGLTSAATSGRDMPATHWRDAMPLR